MRILCFFALIIFISSTLETIGHAENLCSRDLQPIRFNSSYTPDDVRSILNFLYQNTPADYLSRGGLLLPFLDIARRLSKPSDRESILAAFESVGFLKTDYSMLKGAYVSPRSIMRARLGWRKLMELVNHSNESVQRNNLNRLAKKLLRRGQFHPLDHWRSIIWLLMSDGAINNSVSTRGLLIGIVEQVRWHRILFTNDDVALARDWIAFDGEVAARIKRTELAQAADEIAKKILENESTVRN